MVAGGDPWRGKVIGVYLRDQCIVPRLWVVVVVAGEHHWSGFRPDRVKAVAAQQRSSSPSPPDTAAAMSELVRATAAPTTAAELTAQHHHTDPTHAAAVHSPVPHQQSGRSRW